MAAPILGVSAGALLVVAALVLWIASGRRAAGWLAAALLLVWGAVTVATAAAPVANDAGSAITLYRTNVWYSLVLPPLFVGVAAAVLRSRQDAAIAGALGAANAAALILFVRDPRIFVERVVLVDGQWSSVSGPLLYFLGAQAALAQAYVVVRVGNTLARGGEEGARPLHAAGLAVALALPLVHNGAFFLAFAAASSWPLAPPLTIVRAAATAVAALVAIPFLARVVRVLPARRVLLTILAAVAVVGLVDGVVGARRLAGASYGGYTTSLVLVRILFAGALAIVAFRYGLAGVGASERPRVQRTVRAGAAASVAIAAFSLATFVVGTAPTGLLIAGGLAILVPIGTFGGLRRASQQLLLPPSDPRAIAERARTYAAAVAAARGADGRILPEGEKLLAQMREDLGISEQEHALLVSGVASRDEERYHTLETLGRGSTAQVELAMDEVAGKRVVVKRFTGLRDPAAVLKEARSLAAVRHPRVVPFLEVDRRGDDVYLVLAYAEGGSARQLLDREGPLAPERALALTRDLLEGLEALHAAGLVHCDVKPENLLLDASGRGMLGDFGSARFVAPALADATLTGAAAEGSLSTVSPEALRGAAPAPTRDTYAAGALLYRLLTGEHYVELADATVFEARERILMDAPRLPHARVPAALEPALAKALAKRPAERYQSAREMREALTTAARART